MRWIARELAEVGSAGRRLESVARLAVNRVVTRLGPHAMRGRSVGIAEPPRHAEPR